MTDRCTQLIEVAREYVERVCDDSVVCAYAGGSVGRGDADSYSDIDLMFYHESAPKGVSAGNVRFDGEEIQYHHAKLPSAEEARANPWDFRFLSEARAVYDPTKQFETLKYETVELLQTPDAMADLVRKGLENVEARRTWAETSLAEDSLGTASMAAMACVADAILLFSYVQDRCTSTGDLMGKIAPHLPDVAEKVAVTGPVPSYQGSGELEGRLEGVASYRDHLRGAESLEFETDPIHQELVVRKVRRLAGQGEELRAIHELYHQNFWLVRLASGSSLEDHRATLEPPMLAVLDKVGFAPLERSKVRELLACAGTIAYIGKASGA